MKALAPLLAELDAIGDFVITVPRVPHREAEKFVAAAPCLYRTSRTRSVAGTARIDADAWSDHGSVCERTSSTVQTGTSSRSSIFSAHHA
jgi:hypothetical protein